MGELVQSQKLSVKFQTEEVVCNTILPKKAVIENSNEASDPFLQDKFKELEVKYKELVKHSQAILMERHELKQKLNEFDDDKKYKNRGQKIKNSSKANAKLLMFLSFLAVIAGIALNDIKNK